MDTLWGMSTSGHYYVCVEVITEKNNKTCTSIIMHAKHLHRFEPRLFYSELLNPFKSAVSLMGTAAEVIFFGGINYISYVGMALSYVIGYFTLVPLMSPLKLTSVYEYLKLR